MKTTEEKNRMIAEFMGYVRSGFNGELVFNTETREEFEVEQLKYHTSWDWLMPVVFKICEMKGAEAHRRHIVCMSIRKDISFTYNAVVEFIEWYNENNKKL